MMCGCGSGTDSSATNSAINNTQKPLFTERPVFAVVSGLYFVPGCPTYDRIPEHKRIVFETAQEAVLSGYRHTKSCEAVTAARLTVEKLNLGEMHPTPETKRHRIELLRFKELLDSMDSLETRQDDLGEKFGV